MRDERDSADTTDLFLIAILFLTLAVCSQLVIPRDAIPAPVAIQASKPKALLVASWPEQLGVLLRLCRAMAI